MPTCYTQRSRGACTFEGRHNCIKGKRPPSLFVRFIPIRDGVRGGAGWATALPDFCLTNSKIRFFFCHFNSLYQFPSHQSGNHNSFPDSNNQALWDK